MRCYTYQRLVWWVFFILASTLQYYDATTTAHFWHFGFLRRFNFEGRRSTWFWLSLLLHAKGGWIMSEMVIGGLGVSATRWLIVWWVFDKTWSYCVEKCDAFSSPLERCSWCLPRWSKNSRFLSLRTPDSRDVYSCFCPSVPLERIKSQLFLDIKINI